VKDVIVSCDVECFSRISSFFCLYEREMSCNDIDLRWNLFFEAWKIFDNVFSKNDDDDVNWFESSFIIDSIWMYRDLKTQNFLNVRYFSVLTQKSLQASRKVVLSTAHSDEYFEDSANVARVIRDLILIIDDICDFTRVMMIIWTIWNSSSIKISRANLWSASQNCCSWKTRIIVSASRWIMKALWNIHARRIEIRRKTEIDCYE
jgi:hypothetical protein